MADTDQSTDEWREELEQMRSEKDEFFAQHRQSPIPPEERDSFDGLEYFAPTEQYRVEATVHVQDEPEQVELETSDGRAIEYLRALTFEFEFDEEHELHGYRQNPDEATIFVPFTDETTGDRTYDGGRYMELEPERDLAEGDRVTVDFNLAYSPFCAFSETFSCPLPPERNHIDTTVEAGEKIR